MKKVDCLGFSLMPIMVSMGFLGLLSISFLQYQKSSRDTQKQDEVMNSLIAVESRINSVLASGDGCNQTILKTGPMFNPETTIRVAEQFSSLNNGRESIVFTRGQLIDKTGKIKFSHIDFHKEGNSYFMSFNFNRTDKDSIFVRKFAVNYTLEQNGVVKSCTGK